jgi:hypothetical protein
MQIVTAEVIDAFLSVMDAIRVTPTEQARQLCRQHSGALWRQIEKFSIIHLDCLCSWLSGHNTQAHKHTSADRMARISAMFVISRRGSPSLNSTLRLMKYHALSCRIARPNCLHIQRVSPPSSPSLCFTSTRA